MYKVSVPVIVGNPRFERYYKRYIELFKEAKVDRVFLCAAMWTSPECEKQRCQALLSRFAPIFKNEGFEVGVWINSLGHGGTCADFVNNDASDGLTRMVSLDGHINYGAYCPLCENVRALANDWIGRLGATGVDMIMLDDDYRYGYRGEILCACDKHKAVFEKELGEKFDSKRMKDALTSGGPNKWRDAWLKVQGESLIDFAKMLRNTLNKKNPSV
ncbi:MAG: hypothetical protein IJB99_10200, partial [Clostridia bacterium]|nr:hypothetical protein [Clostridia bacterium]